MKIKYLIAGLALLLCSCTVNMENRIHEMLTVQTGAYPKTKDIQVVKDRSDTGTFSLRLEEGNSLSTRKGIYPVYVLKAESIPLNERFILARIDRVTGKIDPQCEFEALEDGALQIYRRDGISKEREIPFVASEGLKAGYPIDYCIVSKKNYASAAVEFIPYPIEVAGENGEKLEAIVNHRMATRFLLRAQGFFPSEELTLIHTSGNQKEEIKVTADETGSFETHLNPTILGRLNGDARVEVERAGGNGLTLDYPWGNGIDKKTWNERAIFPILFVANRSPDEEYPVGLTALLE